WRVRFDPSAVEVAAPLPAVDARRQRYRAARGHQQALRTYWLPLLRNRHLSVAQKVETLLFLAADHVPVLGGLGVLLIVLGAFGIGAAPASALAAMAILMIAGPFVEIAVGPQLNRPRRRAGRLLVGFLPSFGRSIVTAVAAYLDGMWGRPYRRPKRTATAIGEPAQGIVLPPQAGTPDADSLSFARREALALSELNARIGAPADRTARPQQQSSSDEVLAP
ncbi:MAG TPA: hypothetical protein VFO77_02085, partial [Actinoplanes sp.]|nr:hypothetical protein [Actinoplanes sp.]